MYKYVLRIWDLFVLPSIPTKWVWNEKKWNRRKGVELWSFGSSSSFSNNYRM